jgi:hypothetical protein
VSFLQDSIDEADDELLFLTWESSDLFEAKLQLWGWARLAAGGFWLTAQQLSDGPFGLASLALTPHRRY